MNQLKAIPLSIDYKPDMPEERNRILMTDGLVEQATNCLGVKLGPFRIFAPGKDYQGLTMSRSIGDLEGKNLVLLLNQELLNIILMKKLSM